MTQGSCAGHAWLVDPLYKDAERAVHRFSGTTEAGDNSNKLAGRTCDALAHYSHFNSDGTIVFVDIEGV